MSTLTKIVSLAKKLKKEAPNKFAKWTDYIKEASKKIKPVIKKAKKVVKTVSKKAKKHFGETHKDTNSHNVKLSIYSGNKLAKNESRLSYAKPLNKLSVVTGDKPHKAKYYITYNKNKNLVTEYFEKLPKDKYKGTDKINYVMRFTDSGTTLIPLYVVKTDKVSK